MVVGRLCRGGGDGTGAPWYHARMVAGRIVQFTSRLAIGGAKAISGRRRDPGRRLCPAPDQVGCGAGWIFLWRDLARLIDPNSLRLRQNCAFSAEAFARN